MAKFVFFISIVFILFSVIITENTSDQSNNYKKNLENLLRIVRNNKAEGCVQRVICEISAKPNQYGQEGNRFGRSLMQWDKSNASNINQYRMASNVGTRSKSLQLCNEKYKCHMQSIQIIRLGNSILQKHKSS